MTKESGNTCNTTCIYAESRCGKTREVGTMARYVWHKYGLKTRLVFCDGGGWGVIQPEIDAGLIIPLRITGHPDFANWMQALSRGFWPDDNTLNGKLVPYESHPEANEIGMYAIEGISAVCQEYMQWMVRKKIKVSSDVVGFQKILPTGTNADSALAMELGAASESHYGNTGMALYDFIRNFQRLAEYGVHEVVWTSLEAGGEEKIAGMKRSIIGVGAIGKAITPTLPAKFGDLFHLEREVLPNGKVEYRAYYCSHVDKELGNRTWPASMRLTSQASHSLSVHPEFKKGYIVLTDEEGSMNRTGISALFKWRDEQTVKGADYLKKMMAEKKAEGLKK